VTELRYLPDADDVTTFTATVTGAIRDSVILDGTYFYPDGGGQPADRGVLEWDGGSAEVIDVRKDHGEVHHEIELQEDDLPVEGATVEGRIDETRRRQLRRIHTAQHVVSRVVLEEYGARTAGNRIYPDRSRIDFEPASFSDDDLARIERRANEAIDRDLAVLKENRPRATAEAAVDEGRAPLDLIPESVDPLRIVEIEGFDLCPCGGTHVSRIGEIGRVNVTEHASKGKDVDRIEFELADA
jgi:misacylated tRNA(Ala) deacylase